MEGVNLEAFEKMVYARDSSQGGNEAVANELFGILGKIRNGGGFVGPDDAVAQMYTRLAAAITAFLADSRCNLTIDGFIRLCAQHAILHAIFRASAFETMDHIIAIYGTRKPGAEEKIDFSGEQAICKMLLCWSLDSNVEVDFEAVAQSAPHHAAAAMIGMLGVGGSHTAKSYERRLMLMRLRHLIDAVPLHEQMIQAAGDCYMHCSYTDAPDKHEIKAVINRKLRECVLRSVQVQEASTEVVRRDRPTLLMPLEWFGSHHAMYRCYAPSVMQLKEKFRLVALLRHSTAQPSIDEAAKQVFDRVVEIGNEDASIDSFLRAIQQEAPDIIYYPSLGMAAWYVALSTFRLAPIQVVSPGHPATTMSPVIDYIVSDGDLFGNPENYSERLVPLPVGTVRYIGRSEGAPEAERKADGVVRCAIPAMASKMIPPFLEALAQVRSLAKTPVEFHFFPNMTGLSHTVITKDLRRWLPDAIVRPRAGYEQYMKWFGACDVVLSTFPFGGTNSIIDAFLMGLPVITWEGDQVLSRSDASMMRRVSLPDWLITRSRDEYIAAALRFIDGGDIQRYQLRQHLKSVDIEKEFFGAPPPGLEGGFLAAFEQLHEQSLGESNDEARAVSQGAG